MPSSRRPARKNEENSAMSNSRSNRALARRIARLLRDVLEHGGSIDIDGLGTLAPGGKHGFQFRAHTRPRVFIAYVEEDLAFAKKLYRAFERSGFRPWLDKKRLMPGQNWPRAIETAIQTSDFFVACFSRRATSKRGSFHSELRYALFCAAKVPLDEIFLIPLRLDECVVPPRISRQTQYLDLFPDWNAGVSRLLAVMKSQQSGRKRKRLAIAG
jgi:TIR domain